MGQIIPAEIGNTKLAEDVIEDGISKLNAVITLDRAIGFEARKGIGLDKFFERDAILQANGNGDGEIIHQATEGCAFFVHVDKDFTEATIFKLACMEIDFMTTD